ncbi:hypothetical protein AEB_P2460 [Altererythrobacter sp. B11]|nr:hypothetical protein AEB_P2460 [Altererythrobacter sp. B11]
MIKHSEEFKQEAVRIALTSGLPRERVASDLGVGKSTLNKWVSHYRPSDLVPPTLVSDRVRSDRPSVFVASG